MIANSFKWSALEKTSQLFVQLIVSIVLARLLSPSEYAIIGLLNIFIVISNVLVDSGYSQGLIRKSNCDNDDYNSVFWLNLLVSLIIYFVLYLSASQIANIFGIPELLLTSRVLFLSIPLNALNLIQITIINKKLQFKKIATYTLFSTLFSGIIAIALAIKGCGVWALIIQYLLNILFATILFWLNSDWKPAIRFKVGTIKELSSFSLNLMLSSFVTAVFNNIYTVMIAKLYKPVQLGYYSQALKYSMVPSSLIESIIIRVSYPILVTQQADISALGDLYKKIYKVVFFFSFALMAYCILNGRELILILLGEKWSESVVFFKLLCVAGITYPLHPLSLSILKVYNRSDVILKLEILKKVILVVLIILLFNYGVIGLVWSQILYYYIALFLNMFFSGKYINYSFTRQLLDVSKEIVCISIAWLVSESIQLISLDIILSFILKSIIFCIVLYTLLYKNRSVIIDLLSKQIKAIIR